ncbi:MAG: hypothetical protein FJW22_00845 [Acidimicrobiia bacterium]|nr:hypothetical protein [Acidimicrobiia bacterium]
MAVLACFNPPETMLPSSSMVDGSLTERVEALEVFRDEVRLECRTLREGLRQEIREGDEETRRLTRESEGETRRQMHEMNDETRRQMRVLHDEVVDRIKTPGEQLNGGAHPPKPRRRR